MTEHPKVLVIGLDAAEKDLVLAWAQYGWLPTFRRLLDCGAWAVTQGPLGMPGGAGWQSLFTAVSPAKHGHHADRQIRVGTYEMRRARATALKREAFWNALSRAQRRVAVIDVPYVGLSEKINGVHVVDWITHAPDSGFSTWPPELGRQLRKQFGVDRLGLCDHMEMRSAEQFAAFRDALIARVATKVAASHHLLRQGPWDLFMTVFGESHCIGHQCWHLHDPTHPSHDPTIAGAVGDPMLAVYRALDDAVGRLVGSVGPETTVLVFCSHGMGPNYYGAHLLGDVLARLGHRPPPPAQPRWLWRVVRRGWRRLPQPLRARLTPMQKNAVDFVWPELDSHATCFDVPNAEVYGAIRVNLVGREPQGKVTPGAQYDVLCEELRHDLCALVNPDTGQPAVRRVLRTADIYQGPYLGDLPDLLVEWNGDAPLEAVDSPKTGMIRRALLGPRTGHHRPHGLLLAAGPGIKPGQITAPASVMDIGPTIAANLGVALPDTDGHAIAACVACRR
jgi:predicted AlkP superfamily phosphohydrolase/phosphomutase